MATILVAEDEKAVRTLVALILQTSGHQVVVASSGVEAVSLFRFSPDRFDLVITDLKMPVMSGQQVVKLIRETRPGSKILCMSGFSEDPIPDGVEFLQKPFQPDALLARVGRLLDQG